MSKTELVALVKHQLNVDIENDATNTLNQKRKVLYTQIKRINLNSVMSFLEAKGFAVESHVNDYYFVNL